ncbi:ThiF family adenylyltransferase [Rhodonellum sp.]|uniref:ThiF family adenylyltransferase n=1 Tax=Rhodonellum sp. TaxID=2231180 RepID=UPI00271FEF37|nr:ThiF family adenylyltransferase [Rhodonellum sp.]MDO9554330.1 ThiF family adenylyltransferase [Rhodonellum sp.]
MNFNLKSDSVQNSNHLLLNPSVPKDSDFIKELRENPLLQVMDELESQVSDLIKLQNPSLKFTSFELKKQVEEFFDVEDRLTYGNWVYYPWKNALVRILPEEEFIAVRTARNKFKITQEEQDLLSTKKIGVIGLSVGQSVAIALAMERSFGELRIADFDTLELSNLNRIRTGLYNLGLKKTTIVAREIAEIDPYLKVIIFENGVSSESMDDFFTENGTLDLVIEECDSLEIKIETRIKAKNLGIPVLMDTSDRGMIDIERFDLEPNRMIFHGFLEKFGSESEILDLFAERKVEILMSILDFENISSAGKYSMSQIGLTITNWPQPATTVMLGGAACAYYCRMVLTKKNQFSGRIYVDLDQYLEVSHES